MVLFSGILLKRSRHRALIIFIAFCSFTPTVIHAHQVVEEEVAYPLQESSTNPGTNLTDAQVDAATLLQEFLFSTNISLPEVTIMDPVSLEIVPSTTSAPSITSPSPTADEGLTTEKFRSTRTTRARRTRTTPNRQYDPNRPLRPICEQRPCRFPYRPTRPGPGIPFRPFRPTPFISYTPSSSKPSFQQDHSPIKLQQDAVETISIAPQQVNINLSIILHPQGHSSLEGSQIEVVPTLTGSNLVFNQVGPKPVVAPQATSTPAYEEYYDDDSAKLPIIEENELEAYGGINSFKPLHQKRPNEEQDVVLAL